MKRKNLVLLISLTLLSLTAFAQPADFLYGKTSKEEIDLKAVSWDKDAEAVVLYDLGSSYFISNDNGFEVCFERKTKIKILKNAGLTYANVEIPYYQEGQIYERITEIEATTYNFEEGKINVSKLDLKNCFDEKMNEYWNLKKFAIPDVKEGSVLECRYKIISPYKFNLRDWEFQWKIPVMHSEYTVKIIPFYEYTFILQGADKLDKMSSYIDNGLTDRFAGVEYKTMVYEFGLNNIPAFRDEEFITSSDDYIIKIDFQLSKFTNLQGTVTPVISSWPEMIKELIKHEKFGKQIDKTEKSAAKIFDYDKISGLSSLEKAEKIINYVKSNYNWSGVNDKYAYKNPKEFLAEKTGNSADINLFMTGLLRAAGIEADPVILSTRDNGKIKSDYPFMHFFNYVVVRVKADDTIFLADAAEILSPFDQIPLRCVNEKGLLIKKDIVEWVELTNTVPSAINNQIQIDFSPGLEQQSCRIRSTFSGYDALYFRSKFNDKTEKIEEYLHNEGYKKLDSVRTEGFREINKEYVIEFQLQWDIERLNDKIFLAPFLIEPVSENPFKQVRRTYPIDMTYPRARCFKTVVSLPANYTVESVPEDTNFENALVKINYKTEIEGSTLIAEGCYTFKKAVYDATDYSKLKYFYNEIIKKFNQKIVLIKN
ncbi:MAG: DUF3857 domain-containing protein [Bacteroidales bacterium]|nr:DUF3857 domain-containing protein [Bacteroidales bacterium]